MIIVFEGPDGVGKSTLKKAFSKATNEKYTCIDRMYPSDIIYACKYNRGRDFIKKKEWEFNDFDINNRNIGVIYIFIDASFEEICKTFELKKEAVNAKEVLVDKLAFKHFYDFGMYSPLSITLNKIYLDRTNKTVEQCVRFLIEEIKKYENK